MIVLVSRVQHCFNFLKVLIGWSCFKCFVVFVFIAGLGQTREHPRSWCQEARWLGWWDGWRVGATDGHEPWIQGAYPVILTLHAVSIYSVLFFWALHISELPTIGLEYYPKIFTLFTLSAALCFNPSFSVCVCCPQGEWKPREIDNPAYKGKWIHPEIDNPEYTADSEIYKYDSVGVIGLDLWQVSWMCIYILMHNEIYWNILKLFTLIQQFGYLLCIVWVAGKTMHVFPGRNSLSLWLCLFSLKIW